MFSRLSRYLGGGQAANQRGFTLVEAVVTMSVFALGIVGLAQLSTLAKATSEQGRDTVQASNYLQEGVEAVRSVRDSAWTNVSTDGAYRLNPVAATNPPWQLVAGGTESVGKFSRTVQIASVKREDTDSSGTLTAGDKIMAVDDPDGANEFDDPSTKRITVNLSWQQGTRTINRALYAYLTDWQS